MLPSRSSLDKCDQVAQEVRRVDDDLPLHRDVDAHVVKHHVQVPVPVNVLKCRKINIGFTILRM